MSALWKTQKCKKFKRNHAGCLNSWAVNESDLSHHWKRLQTRKIDNFNNCCSIKHIEVSFLRQLITDQNVFWWLHFWKPERLSTNTTVKLQFKDNHPYTNQWILMNILTNEPSGVVLLFFLVLPSSLMQKSASFLSPVIDYVTTCLIISHINNAPFQSQYLHLGNRVRGYGSSEEENASRWRRNLCKSQIWGRKIYFQLESDKNAAFRSISCFVDGNNHLSNVDGNE